MRRSQFVSTLFLAAALMAMNSAPASAQSVGGNQSERSGTDTQTPVNRKSRSSGTADKSKSGMNKSAIKAPSKGDTCVGGSQSERSGTDTQTPLQPGSPSSGKSPTK
jgi:hypothetical protein